MRTALIVLAALVTAGCSNPNAAPDLAPEELYAAKEFRHCGHTYLVFRDGHGISAIHSESCPCWDQPARAKEQPPEHAEAAQ